MPNLQVTLSQVPTSKKETWGAEGNPSFHVHPCANSKWSSVAYVLADIQHWLAESTSQQSRQCFEVYLRWSQWLRIVMGWAEPQALSPEPSPFKPKPGPTWTSWLEVGLGQAWNFRSLSFDIPVLACRVSTKWLVTVQNNNFGSSHSHF